MEYPMPPDADPMSMERIDLHTHTTWSSGFCEPDELVRRASLGGVRTLAITDHHQVAGYAEAVATAMTYGVTLIPAVEIDCRSEGRNTDLLGYWIDPCSATLHAFLQEWPDAWSMLVENPRWLAPLATVLDVPLDLALLRTISGNRPPTILHLMLALVALGWSQTVGDAYTRFQEVRQQPGFPRLHRDRPSIEAGAAVIRAAGGVVTLAHPGLVHDDDLVRRLVATRVVDAIEAHYGGYWKDGDSVNGRYQRLAREHHMSVSAGSDYHARPFDDIALGVTVPADTVARLRLVRKPHA